MTRTTRILVHGTGAILLLALIGAPVWDAWRYRDMRPGVSPRVPLAILLAPERERTPALASVDGPGFESSPAGGPAASSRRSTTGGSGRGQGAANGTTRGSRPATQPAMSGGIAAASPPGAEDASSDLHSRGASDRVRDRRDAHADLKPDHAVHGQREPGSNPPPSQSKQAGSQDASPGGLESAVLLGPRPVGTDIRSVAPTPAPTPPTPARVAGGSSAPRDPGVGAVQDPEVSLLASQTALSVGDQLTVTVNVQAADHVTSLPFHLLFDPAVLEFSNGATDASLGSRLQPVLLASVSPNRPGDLAVGLSFIESAGAFTGTGGIVVLHFRAIGSGDTDLQFSRASLRGATSQPLAAAFHNARVTVH